jgi:taurine dioxygenase
MSALQIRPIAGSLGAEVLGVDLAAVDDVTQAGLREAWLEHLVLFFRDQDLDVSAYLDAARRFGEPVPYPFVPGLEGHPEVIEIAKLPGETVNFGGIWHSDTTYLDEPPMASILLAREVPPFGGDTLFANQYAAFEALSPSLQEVLTPLRAVNSSALADVSKTREDRIRDAGTEGYEPDRADYEAVHPVVRTHPETGRRALFVNIAHTARFDGMTEEESRPLLSYLFAHQVRPEFTCRFSWQVGSVALWDNRCVQHNPVNDYHGHTRRMHRITLAGDRPR